MNTIEYLPSPHTDLPASDPLLDSLLDAELDFDPVARGGFINHLAMELVAGRRLGASDDTLRTWYSDSATGTFLRGRSRPAELGAVAERIDRDGIAAELSRRLPDLVDAPSEQFFHAIIRLELALDARHPGQIANALHNWEQHRGDPVVDAPKLILEPTGSRSFREVIDELGGVSWSTTDADWTLRPAGRSPEFLKAMTDLRVDDRLLDDVMAVALAGHVDPRDFGTLHIVTGTRAARAVSPWLDGAAARALALHTAGAVAAAHLSLGGTPLPSDRLLDEWRAARLPEWGDIAVAAIGTGDPHVIKLVYACRLEHEIGSDALAQAVAARQAGLSAGIAA